MSLVAVCAIFGNFYISFSLQTGLLPAVAVLLVVGPLAAIVMGHNLREKENQKSREDDGCSGPEDP
jgi:hypothetical protein